MVKHVSENEPIRCLLLADCDARILHVNSSYIIHIY